MSEAVSCGGVVIFRGKVLVLYKNFMNSRVECCGYECEWRY